MSDKKLSQLSTLSAITESTLLYVASSGNSRKITIGALIDYLDEHYLPVDQDANLVYAGPSSGAAAAPTFRSLVSNDIPVLDKLSLNTTVSPSPTLSKGMMSWDQVANVPQVKVSTDTVMAIGESQFIPKAKNMSGSPISKGQAVRISTAADGLPYMTVASYSSLIASDTIAVATENVADGASGFFATFGLITGLDTSSLVLGAKIYLSSNGSMTATMPSSPNYPVQLGYCLKVNNTTGVILVSLKTMDWQHVNNISQHATGFLYSDAHPDTEDFIEVHYDAVTRKITLSGNPEAYWRGSRVEALVDGWESPAHTNTYNIWYLYHNGTAPVWSTTAPTFDMIQIAVVAYFQDAKFALREVHGLVMDPATHRELHERIGMYKVDGGNLTFTTESEINRRPTISTLSLRDEDLSKYVSSISQTFTTFYLNGSAPVATPATYNIVPVQSIVGQDRPYWNDNGTQVLMTNDYYQAIFVLAIPAGEDTNSNDHRYLWVQGQYESADIGEIQDITPEDLDLGDLANLPEYYFHAKFIIHYRNDNWVLTSGETLNWSKVAGSTGGSGQVTIYTDATISGTGTIGDPLTIAPGGFTPGYIPRVGGTGFLVDSDLAYGVSAGVGILSRLGHLYTSIIGPFSYAIYVDGVVKFNIDPTLGTTLYGTTWFGGSTTIASNDAWITVHNDTILDLATSVSDSDAYLRIQGNGTGKRGGLILKYEDFFVTVIPPVLTGNRTLTLPNANLDLSSQSANLVFAGPTTGSAAQPSFRALVAADLPSDPRTNLTVTSTKIANYTAAAGEYIPCDISLGSFTVTLPTAPPDKTEIMLLIVKSAADRVLTIQAGGTDKFDRVDGPQTIYMYVTIESLRCTYQSSTGLWFLQSAAAPFNFATGNPGIDAMTPISEADISIDTSTRVLTINTSRGYFDFFVDGGGKVSRIRKTGSTSFPAFTDTTGTWYFYFNSAGTAITTQTPWTSDNFATIAPVYRIYWNASLIGSAKLVDQIVEYHLNTIPVDTHRWMHLYGSIWEKGFTLIDNALTSSAPNADGRNTVIALTTGHVIDDNLDYEVANSTGGLAWQQDLGNTTAASLNATNSAQFKVFIQDSSARASFLSASRFPFSFSANNIPEYITSTGTRTEVSNGYWMVNFVYSIQNPTNGSAIRVVSAPQEFSTLVNARAYNWADIQATYSIIGNDNENRPLYRLIHEVRTNYDVGCKYAVLRESQDLRKTIVTTTSAVSGSLPGSSVTIVPSGTIASTNAQSAIIELDTEKVPYTGATGNLALGSYNLSAAKISVGTDTFIGSEILRVAGSSLLGDISITSATGIISRTGTITLNATDNINLNCGAYSTVLTQTVTTSPWPVLETLQTWNNGAASFTGIKANVTDTASAASSKLMDLQVGSVSKFIVRKTGAIIAGTTTLIGTEIARFAGGTIATPTSTDVTIGGGSIGVGTSINLIAGAQISLAVPTADATVTGPVTASFNAGYSSSVGDLVYFGTGGKWLAVDADAIATCNGLLGIALEAKTDGQAMKVALPGSFVYITAWNWTVNATLYAGETVGAMQATIPTGANAVVRVVGFAIHADCIYFNPSSDHQTVVA